MRWRAFYADGNQHTSVGEVWEALPTEGLVIVVWWDDNGTRHLECGSDAIIMTDVAFESVNMPTVRFEAAAEAEANVGKLKYGRRMEPEAWEAIRAWADEARTPP